MQDNITLEHLNFNQQHKVLDLICGDEVLKQTFTQIRNTQSRILNSSYVGIIKKENNKIGFIMLVYNEKNNTHEIDMGILRDYRNKGYGTKALHELKKLIINQDIKIQIQVQKDNIAAIKTIQKNDFTLEKEDENYNYYSINNDTFNKR